MGSEASQEKIIAVQWTWVSCAEAPIPVKKPQFSEDFPDAVKREGAGKLTLRAEEMGVRRTFIDTSHIELERW